MHTATAFRPALTQRGIGYVLAPRPIPFANTFPGVVNATALLIVGVLIFGT